MSKDDDLMNDAEDRAASIIDKMSDMEIRAELERRLIQEILEAQEND